MKNAEILANYRVGDIVDNKQILNALKRMGFIFGYSEWGYLEGCWINVKHDKDYTYRNLYELFPDGDAPRDTNSISMTPDEWDESTIGHVISYMGCEFDTKYLSGCFKPYLQLVAKDGDRNRTSFPSVSMWGVIR